MHAETVTTVEFAAGSRIRRAEPVPTTLPLVKNGPPSTQVLFPDGWGISVPTDQIVGSDEERGAARVLFGGMRFDGLEEGQLTFRRVREVRPEHELMPERGRVMKIDPSRVHRVLVGSNPVWPLPVMKRLEVTTEDMARTTLFRDLDLGLIIHRLAACPKRTLKPGEVLLQQGQPNDTVYVVLEGHLYVRLESQEHTDVSVAVVGDCIGEMSVIDGRPCAASVLAQEEATVLQLPGELIWSLIDHTTLVSRNLLLLLAGRLRMGDRVISAGQDEKARYQRFATQDLLTGLKNRRWLDDELQRRFEKYRKENVSQAAIMFDVDHFKKFNDTHGHQAGDLVLQRVARAAMMAVEGKGVAARYGGEEFVILAGGVSLNEACQLAETVRLSVANLGELEHEGAALPPVTVSLGVALLAPGMSAGELVKAADQKLYEAKKSGRNRVVPAP